MTRPVTPGSSDATFSFVSDPMVTNVPSTGRVIYPPAFQNGHNGAGPMQMAPPPAEADQPAPVGHNSSKGAQMPKDESGKAPSWATPSKLSLDEAAKASIGTGRYAQERRVLLEAVSDPRLGTCPLPVKLLGAVIEHINGKTGVAFPKVSTLAQEIVNYLNGLPDQHRLPALHNAVTLVRQCGYVVTEKRAPQAGLKAVAHYAITYPTDEEKRAGIEVWSREKQGKEPKPGADLTRGVNSADLTRGMKSGADLTRGVKSEGADLTRGRELTSPGGVKSGGATHYTEPDNINPKTLGAGALADATLFSDGVLPEGTPPPSKGATCKPSKPDVDAALAHYIATAKRCGLPVPRKPAAYLDAIAVRLREGSLDEWREMLAMVERSPHLLGENDRQWKANLEWLSERKNYAKVLDGNYLRNKPKPKPISRY